jgi:hypothetical protein
MARKKGKSKSEQMPFGPGQSEKCPMSNKDVLAPEGNGAKS